METIDDIFSRFKTYKVDIEGRSEKSIDLYITTIKDFCSKMNITSFDEFVGVKAQQIRDWLSIMANQYGNGESTRNSKLSAIKEIYKFLDYQEHINIDRDISRMAFAKVPHRESRYTTSEDVVSLMATIGKDLRVKSCISVIANTGIRFSEVQQLTCKDIDRGYAYIIGKGNKERKITFNKRCIDECNRYINRKRKKIVEKHNLNTDLLFISDGGKRYERRSFEKSLKTYAQKAGIEWADHLSPHKLRHGFITKKLEEGEPIHIVSSAVGHSDLSTTSRYSHANQTMIDEMFKRE